MAVSVATRSISISLDERLLRDLDQELSQGHTQPDRTARLRSPRPLSCGCSSDLRLQQLPLAIALEPDQANGLKQTSYAMGWVNRSVGWTRRS